MKRHALLVFLLAIAGALMLAFAWQPGLATLGDDGASYLVLAQRFAGLASPAARWAITESHFPPLFPLAIAAAGGAEDFRIAHAVVVLFAVLALAATYRYALVRVEARVATAVVLLFLLTPSAWISIKGVMSESMYLFVSMLALHWHATRVAPHDEDSRALLIFGVLLAACVLTRAAGIALVAGYLLQLAFFHFSRRPRPAWRAWLLPVIPVVLLAAAWIALRPHGGIDRYQGTAELMLHRWREQPLAMLATTWRFFFGGWVATFCAEESVAPLTQGALALTGVLALAGSVRRALRGHLDGWYVLASLAITLAWVFSADNARRLDYPIVPLLLIGIAEMVHAACVRWRVERREGLALATAFALPALLSLPALVLVAEKARDLGAAMPEAREAYADITDYYTVINLEEARGRAEMNIAVLGGLEGLRTSTPAEARIMWTRPEYVALLGRRTAVPQFNAWSPRRLAEEIRVARVDYLVTSRLYKTDLDGMVADNPFAQLEGIDAYARPVANLWGDSFVLMKIDPEALARFLR